MTNIVHVDSVEKGIDRVFIQDGNQLSARQLLAQHREQYLLRSQSVLSAEAKAAPDIEVQGSSYLLLKVVVLNRVVTGLLLD